MSTGAEPAMKVRLKREIKSFCVDFRPIRRLLRAAGARFIERKRQVDYFFHLPDAQPGADSRRLKLRLESGKPQLIYYYDRYPEGSRLAEFQVAEVADAKLKEMLERALGVRAVVRKRREVWRKGNAVFNLDEVDGVGGIFEVELALAEGEDGEEEIGEYRRAFEPYLGAEIRGSNEDLIGPSAPPAAAGDPSPASGRGVDCGPGNG